MTLTYRYFLTRNGGVARLGRNGTTAVEVFNRTVGDWVQSPSLIGAMTGLGGDPPLDELSEQAATALLDRLRADAAQ